MGSGYFTSDGDIGESTVSCSGETALRETIGRSTGIAGSLGESKGKPSSVYVTGSTWTNGENGAHGIIWIGPLG